MAFEDVWVRYETADELPTLDFPQQWGEVKREAPPPPTAPPDWTLRGISFRIRPGETVALVGPSGAGKTTIAALIPRFWDAQKGRVSLEGIDVRDLRLADLREAIGLVPQETLLFSGTVRENIAYGRPDASQEDVVAAARAAHAHEFIQLLADGYDTKVGERGIKLSGGQRQRVALARAILKDPAVLVLDEATSSLDAESEALIEDALKRLPGVEFLLGLAGGSFNLIQHLGHQRRDAQVAGVEREVQRLGQHPCLLEAVLPDVTSLALAGHDTSLLGSVERRTLVAVRGWHKPQFGWQEAHLGSQKAKAPLEPSFVSR